MTIAKDQLIKLLGRTDNAVSYEQARDLLDHPDTDVRIALATRADLEPEILYFLARDPDSIVRRAIAVNPNTPQKAHLLLAEDAVEEVRSDLADRVGNLLPELSDEEKEKAYRATHQVMTLLARDQLPRVRRVLSEALKQVPTAPRDIVLTLAKDRDTDVASPILEYSPVLTDDDLLEVISSSPLSASLAAISRRNGVSHAVSDAIFHTGDSSAVASLLNNQSAQIREETLDAIITAAPEQNSWHEPLVHRRDLNSKAALRIAEFVADSLIQQLASRTDFEPGTVDRLKDVVHTRLKKEQSKETLLSPDINSDSLDSDSLALAQQQVDAMNKQGVLLTHHVLSALDDGNLSFALIATASLADVDVHAVRAVINAHSAKGAQAVAWKAGFTAEEAVHLQMALARVPPGDIITPRPDGNYDATESEMQWQIELFVEEAKTNA